MSAPTEVASDAREQSPLEVILDRINSYAAAIENRADQLDTTMNKVIGMQPPHTPIDKASDEEPGDSLLEKITYQLNRQEAALARLANAADRVGTLS